MSGLTAVGAPTRAAAEALDRIAADGRGGIWLQVLDRDVVLDMASRVEDRIAGGAVLPLAGLCFAVKGNIDVAGVRTTAGCRSFGRVAAHHSPVVQLLVDAGAVPVGITNLDQFATGLVGTRSPFGICPNAHHDGLVSGGSSSGSAVAVAAGHVDFSLGTDTAGSGRVPAAANGIFGWKPTRALVSTDGVVPACESLDCVSFFAGDAALLDRLHAVVAPGASESRVAVAGLRMGVAPLAALDFDGDEAGRDRHRQARDEVLGAIQGTAVDVDLDPFLAVGRMLYEGAFVRERYDAVGAFVEAHPDDVDPVVRSIILAAGAIDPADLASDRALVSTRRDALAPLWEGAAGIDVLVVPSVPRLPTVAEVAAAPIAVNAMLGTYTNFVNLLGLCAMTVPVGEATADRPPTSLTLIAPAGSDELLLSLAAAVPANRQNDAR